MYTIHRTCIRQLLSLFIICSISTLVRCDPNEQACQTLSAAISICESLTPGFTTFTNFYFQAPCLCYSSTIWRPDPYDNLVASCYAGYKTAQPAAYASFTASNGGAPVTTPCHKAGNFLTFSSASGSQISRTTSPTTTSSASTPGITSSTSYEPNLVACATVERAEAYCISKSAGFSTFSEFRSQAPCFCYSGLVYAPTYYDNAWGSCVQYLSTSATASYSRLLSAGAPILTKTPCAAVGDVLLQTSPRQATTSPTPVSSSSQTSPRQTTTTTSPAPVHSSSQTSPVVTSTTVRTGGAGAVIAENYIVVNVAVVVCVMMVL